MSFFHKSLTVIKLPDQNLLNANENEKEKEAKPPPKPTAKASFFVGNSNSSLSKTQDIVVKPEPLGEYYESRKKLIFGKVNILEEQSFLSQFLLKSQKKINKEHNQLIKHSFFFDVPQKVYDFCLDVKENISNFCFIIHLYLKLNREDKALEIFLLMCKENKDKLEFMYTKLNLYCKKSSSAMKAYTPPIAKMISNLLSCLIKFSIKFCKTKLQNYFFCLYLKSIFSLNFREIKPGLDYKNELSNNRLFIYTSLLFDSSIFHFYNYWSPEIIIKLLQHCLEIYKDNQREKNGYELVLMMKSNFNCGFFYFIDNKYKESTNCLNVAKELISDIVQYNLNSKEDEKEFLNDLGGYSFLSEEKNTLFCLKFANKRISKLHDKSLNLNLSKYIKDLNNQGKKASSVVLGSKKNELQLPLLLEQIKRKINLEIDLLLCQIEMNKKNYKAAYNLINTVINSNMIKDDFQSGLNSRKKRLGVNKNFRSLKTYQNIRVKPKISEINNGIKTDLSEKEFNLIFSLLEKIEKALSSESLEDKAFIFKKRTLIFPNEKVPLSSYSHFKELEKFFIFICSLSLFQLKILNESQPEYSEKRDDLPIIFTTSFRDSLTNSQRMDLDELETMSLSRYIILVDSKKDISPENLDYKYMKYKVKTHLENEEEEIFELQLSFEEEKNFINNNKIYSKRGRNYCTRNINNNKGIFSSSSNINNSTTVRKTITTVSVGKSSSYRRTLKFNEENDYFEILEKMIRSIRDKKNEKFMSKNRKLIFEYLSGLNLKDKKFLIDNPKLLQKMMDDLANKIARKKQKKLLEEKKIINENFKNDASYSFSFEMSQKSQNAVDK